MDSQHTKPITLASTKNGQVAFCRGCNHCISLEFGAIFQLLALEDFSILERNISSTSAAEYFSRCPGYHKIIVNTSVPNLYFTFTEGEFCELQVLLRKAASKYELLNTHRFNLN